MIAKEMIAEKVFAEGVAKDIRNFLPAKYENAEFQVMQMNKNNGVQMVGVQVRLQEENVCPVVYVEPFFNEIARKNGLDYNVKKIENGKPPTYLVSFKGKDIDVMTEAFREFTAKKLGRDKKPSIRKLLSTLKDKAAALNAQRDKVKKKDREVSL